jgi:hypothetical protein
VRRSTLLETELTAMEGKLTLLIRSRDKYDAGQAHW